MDKSWVARFMAHGVQLKLQCLYALTDVCEKQPQTAKTTLVLGRGHMYNKAKTFVSQMFGALFYT